MTEQHVVGWGLDAGQVLHGYECHVVDESPQNTEPQLCRHKQSSFVSHLHEVKFIICLVWVWLTWGSMWVSVEQFNLHLGNIGGQLRTVSKREREREVLSGLDWTWTLSIVPVMIFHCQQNINPFKVPSLALATPCTLVICRKHIFH